MLSEEDFKQIYKKIEQKNHDSNKEPQLNPFKDYDNNTFVNLLIKSNKSKNNRNIAIKIGKNIFDVILLEEGNLEIPIYNFKVFELEKLYTIIANEINIINSPWISDLKIKCSLDKDNIYIYEKKIPKILTQNDMINLNYTIPRKKIDKINLEISYKLGNNEKIEKKYEIVPKEIPEGDEISKLMIKDLINNISNENEKIKKSLQYQIFNKNTSLFAEVELSDKISKEMKLKIIGNKKNNKLETLKPREEQEEKSENKNIEINSNLGNYNSISNINFNSSMGGMGMSMGPMMSNGPMMCNGPMISNNLMMSNRMMEEGMRMMEYFQKRQNQLEIISQDLIFEIFKLENIMKIIETQNFINGYWEIINEQTITILEKYKKEYELLKGLKDKNIDDKVAITILYIYYINKEHSNLARMFIMSIKKAKLFIEKEIKCSYEEIVENFKSMN